MLSHKDNFFLYKKKAKPNIFNIIESDKNRMRIECKNGCTGIINMGVILTLNIWDT